jgi:hypothetical protein
MRRILAVGALAFTSLGIGAAATPAPVSAAYCNAWQSGSYFHGYCAAGPQARLRVTGPNGYVHSVWAANGSVRTLYVPGGRNPAMQVLN